MSLLVVSASHRTTDLEVLEQLRRPDPDRADLEQEVAGLPGVRQAGVLATCNRVEVLLDTTAPDLTAASVRRVLQRRVARPLRDQVEVHRGHGAVRHVFRVATGLESMAVGETEVRGQLRRCLHQVQQQRRGGDVDRVLQRSLHVARRVHQQTPLAQESRSLLAAAVDLARAELGPLTGLRALVAGAGTYARLAVAELAAAGTAAPTVVNRTSSAAQQVAARGGGRGADLSSLVPELASVALAVFVTGAPGAVLSAADAARVGDIRRGRPPLVLVDLALPRDVDPAAAAVPGVRLLDLEAVGRALAGDGGSAVAAAGDLVDRAAAAEWCRARGTGGIPLQALRRAPTAAGRAAAVAM